MFALIKFFRVRLIFEVTTVESIRVTPWRQGIELNDNQHNITEHKDIKSDTKHKRHSITTL